MNVLLVDNHDSFTFNLVEAFQRRRCSVSVLRNTAPAPDILAQAEASRALIVLSPGPGDPTSAGSCLALITLAKARSPVFGVCLGHQAIVFEAGGPVARAPAPIHGKPSPLLHNGTGMFRGLPTPLEVGRYHSLATPAPPARFHVHATLEGMAFALSDRAALQWSVQFHPESILTPRGPALLANLLDEVRAARPA